MSSDPCAATTRSLAVLRLLGRVEFARLSWIHRLIYADRSRRSVGHALQALHTQGLIWRAGVSPDYVPGTMGSTNHQPAPRFPLIYGLTPEGRMLLVELGVEAYDHAIAAMPVRPWDVPDLRLRQLRHDLQVSEWCCAVLAGVQSHPAVHMVDCQVEYVSAVTPAGVPVQRFDALVTIAVSQHLRAVPVSSTTGIPWPDGRMLPRDCQVCRLAAEIDTGSEKLAILMGKAGTYRALTLSGHYQQTLGSFVLPVVLVPSGTRRASQVAREWRAGWPDGTGVISSFDQAQEEGDALRGRYLTMTTAPTQQVFLLEPWGWTRRSWETMRNVRE